MFADAVPFEGRLKLVEKEDFGSFESKLMLESTTYTDTGVFKCLTEASDTVAKSTDSFSPGLEQRKGTDAHVFIKGL